MEDADRDGQDQVGCQGRYEVDQQQLQELLLHGLAPP